MSSMKKKKKSTKHIIFQASIKKRRRIRKRQYKHERQCRYHNYHTDLGCAMSAGPKALLLNNNNKFSADLTILNNGVLDTTMSIFPISLMWETDLLLVSRMVRTNSKKKQLMK
jgi:hypothetical protein